MKALERLERLGYLFTVDGNDIRYSHYGERPPQGEVRRLLNHLKRRQDEVLVFLRERDALLDQMDTMDRLDWCRQWADLATRAGWPCIGYNSWADWRADIVRTTTDRRAESGLQALAGGLTYSNP